MKNLWRRWMMRLGVIAVASILGFLILMASLLTACQRKLIYYPRPYTETELRFLPPEMVKLEFKTGQGKQYAFYRLPKSGELTIPEALWIVFNGNATNALDWLDFVDGTDERIGVLLLEYPGYGISEGKPSRESIRDAAEGGYSALLAHLGIEKKAMDGRLCVLAQSLGCAAGLEFSTEHPARRIILLSPFTSLYDMAKITVGWPLCYLLADRFDNRKSLERLAAAPVPPEVFIFHGTADNVVPVRMGRELAKEFPQLVTYKDVPNVDHVWITEAVRNDLYALMEPEPAQ